MLTLVWYDDIILFVPLRAAALENTEFSEKKILKNKSKKLLTKPVAHDNINELLLRATTKRRLITEQ